MTITLALIEGQKPTICLSFRMSTWRPYTRQRVTTLSVVKSLRTGDAVFIGAFVAADPVPSFKTSRLMWRARTPCAPVRRLCRARFDREKAYAEIKRLYVAEAHRGGGLARQLMAAIEGDIVAQGIECARIRNRFTNPKRMLCIGRWVTATFRLR